VLSRQAERFLVDAARSGATFDLAFVDPPYGFDGWLDLLDALPAALAVVESGRPVEAPPGWAELRAKRYGRTHVAILERRDLAQTV
jgi:16S rRNA G966 N2-methylase RsmD